MHERAIGVDLTNGVHIMSNFTACYKCDSTNGPLSPRSRCVKCEYESNQFNEAEGEKLRNRVHELEALLEQSS